MISSLRTSTPQIYPGEGETTEIHIPFKRRRRSDRVERECMSFSNDDVSKVKYPFQYAVETNQLPKFKALFNAIDRGRGRNICDVEGFYIFCEKSALFWQENVSTHRLIGNKRSLQEAQAVQGKEDEGRNILGRIIRFLLIKLQKSKY